ncbi:MAG: 50S ribosomal protein L10 [Candidatus Neomarinimicrobiota bacterium]|nr:50S ribosomal protein L10 [Candidatus Neomarinimicrobiota bacterium]
MPSVKNINSVKELSVKLDKAKAVYFTDYLGLDVVSVTKLRKNFVEKDVEFTVAKNTLIKLAAKEVGISGIDEFLEGSTAIAFGYDDPTGPARVIKEFLKDFDKPSVKGMIFDGEIFTSDQFDKIANLPSKEQLLSKLVGMLNSPMSKLSSVLNSSVSGLLGRLTQLNSKKGN